MLRRCILRACPAALALYALVQGLDLRGDPGAWPVVQPAASNAPVLLPSSPTVGPHGNPFPGDPIAPPIVEFPVMQQPEGVVAGYYDPNSTWTGHPGLATSAELAPTVDLPADVDTRLETLEKKFNGLVSPPPGPVTYPNIKINGVFQADAGWIAQDDVSLARYGRIKDGADFRRARLAASGSVSEVHNYFFQMDFAFFGRPTFTDIWVEQTDLPVLGTVRVGQWKQPFSLEVVSSFRYTTFVERSVLFQPFTPFRHLGIGFYNRNEALTSTWAASVFAAGQDQYGGSISTAGGVGTAERITWLPYYDEPSEGRYYLHLGAGHYFSAPNDRNVNFRTIPEMFIGSQATPEVGGIAGQQPVPGVVTGVPFFVATGNLSVYNYNVLGTELLYVHGPWSLQSEAMVNFVNQTNGEDLIFSGAYAQVGYFLTGEHRPYDRKAGAIDRIKPFENVFKVRSKEGGVCRGIGAWEVAGRASTIHLNDGSVRGGILTDLTAGLNWYLNPYTKAQFNYIHAHSTDAAAATALTHLFDARIQVDF